jgi:hypothetical protein
MRAAVAVVCVTAVVLRKQTHAASPGLRKPAHAAKPVKPDLALLRQKMQKMEAEERQAEHAFEQRQAPLSWTPNWELPNGMEKPPDVWTGDWWHLANGGTLPPVPPPTPPPSPIPLPDQLVKWPAEASSDYVTDDQINYHREHGWPINATQWLKNQWARWQPQGGLNVTNTTYPCYSQYAFSDLYLGDLKMPVTVDYRLMNLSHNEAEVRYCVDHNPKFNGDLFVECRNSELVVDNSSCYPDIYPAVMVDMHIGVFKPPHVDPGFRVNDTQLINITGLNASVTAPWDPFILRFSEVVKAGSGSVKITEHNPPEVRRDYIGPIIDIPVDDYYQVFFGEDLDNWQHGVAVIKSKAGHLKTKNGGQLYSIDIPEGALVDRAGNPAQFAVNQTSLHLEFKVMDIVPPHIKQDWVQAFFPLDGDTGRFVHHNVTISWDEPVLRRGSPDAVIRLEPRVADDEQCYRDYGVHGCGPVYLDESHAPIDLPLYGPQVVMLETPMSTAPCNVGMACSTMALFPGKLEFGVTYAVVIADADIRDASGLNFTGLGTLDQGNYFFTTATEKQMQLRTEIVFFKDYDKKRLQDTMNMFHTTTGPMDMPWQDSFAKLRLLTLTWAIGEAEKVLADPYGLPVESDLQNIVNELKKDRFEPRGVPFGDPWVCKDFQSHMLQSVGFDCMPAVQKTSNGFDIISRTATFYYRDGCLCHSHYVNNCPFTTQAATTYMDFGFSGMDQKVVAPGNALCWYWSLSSNPEWGYMSSPSNYFNATDPADDERLVKQFWSWDAAHRPTEAAARDPVSDHYGIEASLLHGAPSVQQRAKAESRQPLTRPLPASARRMRLKRTPHTVHHPNVPAVTVPKVMDAVRRVLPTLPPEPPDVEPTRYPLVAEAVPTPWMEPLKLPSKVKPVAATAAERVEPTNVPPPMNPHVWYGNQ